MLGSEILVALEDPLGPKTNIITVATSQELTLQ